MHDTELLQELNNIRDAGLLRQLRVVGSPQGRLVEIDGRELLNFSSNDYLGLANHPALKEAAVRAIEKYGAGSGASRLICGSLAVHHELEQTLASFKETEAALTFSTGYATAVGTIATLAGKDDVVVLDKLVHASIVDAARLSGATLRIFKHNDLNDLAKILAWADARFSAGSPPAGARRPRVLVVTETVFSMDGDVAPLREMVELKEKHGAWLMVDEAHATGIIGAGRRGVAEAQGVAGQIDIQMGTLGKAIGAGGGYICGSRALIDLLVNRARSFIFSTAPPPAQSAAARAGIEVIQSAEGEQRRNAVWDRMREVKTALSQSPWRIPETNSAILPVVIGAEAEALDCAARLRDAGLFVPAIRYPTVARGSARLRITVTASHSPADTTKLAQTLAATSQ